MAKFQNRYPENVPGSFYVDSRCIDCDMCRQCAPAFFQRKYDGSAGHSYIAKQPKSVHEINLCREAMEGCPVQAIGVVEAQTLQFDCASQSETALA